MALVAARVRGLAHRTTAIRRGQHRPAAVKYRLAARYVLYASQATIDSRGPAS